MIKKNMIEAALYSGCSKTWNRFNRLEIPLDIGKIQSALKSSELTRISLKGERHAVSSVHMMLTIDSKRSQRTHLLILAQFVFRFCYLCYSKTMMLINVWIV